MPNDSFKDHMGKQLEQLELRAQRARAELYEQLTGEQLTQAELSLLTQGKQHMQPKRKTLAALFSLLKIITSWISNPIKRSLKEKVIELPPGTKLADWSRFIFSKKSYERVIEPLIADLQEEWLEATMKNKIWHSRWIQVRYAISYIQNTILIIGGSVAKTIKTISKIQ